MKKKNLFKAWHGISAVVVLVAVVASIELVGGLRADAQVARPAAPVEEVVSRIPQAAVSQQGVVRSLENGEIEIAPGDEIPVGRNRPAEGDTPGTPSQPLPTFSGINTPLWTNELGPVQIADDLIVHGITDVRMGFMNNEPYVEPERGDDYAPLPPEEERGDDYAPLPPQEPVDEVQWAGPAGPSLTPALSAAGPIGPITVVAPSASTNVMQVRISTSINADQTFNSIRFGYVGTATGSDVRFTLKDETNAVLGSNVAPLNGEVVFNPNQAVPRNTVKMYTVYASVPANAVDNRTFTLSISASAKISATYPVGQRVEVRGGVYPMTGPTVTINAPAVVPGTLSVVQFSPPAKQITHVVDPTDTDIFGFRFTAASGPVTISGMRIILGGSAVSTDFRANGNFLLKDDMTDAVIASSLPRTGMVDINLAGQFQRVQRVYVDFPNNINIASGASKTVMMYAPIAKTATSRRTISAGFEFATNIVSDAKSTNGVFPMRSGVHSIALADEPQSVMISQLFGVEVARAQVAEPAPQLPDQNGVNGGMLRTPVRIFDDLLVYGNGLGEPGRIVSNGEIVAGRVGSTSQITGNLRIISGGIVVGNGPNAVSLSVTGNTIHTGSVTITGPLTTTGNVTTNGNVTTTGTTTNNGNTTINGNLIVNGGVGHFTSVITPNPPAAPAPIPDTTWRSIATSSCPVGDQIISCDIDFLAADGTPPEYTLWFSKISGNDCRAYARRTVQNVDGVVGWGLRAKALCFSPN